VTNVSSTKPVEYEVTAYGFGGNIILGPAVATRPPNSSTNWQIFSATAQFHCQLKVLTGGRRNVRLAASVRLGDTDVTLLEGR